jgi:hypothetical protein
LGRLRRPSTGTPEFVRRAERTTENPLAGSAALGSISAWKQQQHQRLRSSRTGCFARIRPLGISTSGRAGSTRPCEQAACRVIGSGGTSASRDQCSTNGSLNSLVSSGPAVQHRQAASAAREALRAAYDRPSGSDPWVGLLRQLSRYRHGDVTGTYGARASSPLPPAFIARRRCAAAVLQM